MSRWIPRGVLIVALVVLACAPWNTANLGQVLPGAVNSVGSLNLIALMLLGGATALTLDLMFGYTGLLSMGHALYFGVGCYSVVIVANLKSVSFGVAVLVAFVITVVCALVGNASALKLTGFGFAMATLALAQLLVIFVERGYWSTGGEVGVTYTSGALPRPFTGLVNTDKIYLLSLGTLVLVYLVARFAVATEAGAVWQAIRENPLRAQVLGINVYAYRLAAATLSSVLAGVCGMAYSIVMGGANPSIISLEYSLGLILMVVLGGRGVLWGAVLGGVVYTYLTLRLAALATTPAIQDLPDVLRVPLAQPKFLLGVLFVLVILFLPGGLASLARRRRHTPEPKAPAREKVLT